MAVLPARAAVAADRDVRFCQIIRGMEAYQEP